MKYPSYLLAMLMAIFACASVDRVVLGLVLENIRVDLHLTDTQMGFVNGVGYALFFSLMGVPMARWADRGNRIVMVSVTAVVWSAAVALCGAVSSFAQLFVARAVTATGEAGCMPPAHSLIPDYFERSERPRAVARYMLGGPLSLIVGYFVGGWLNQLFGWRTMFVVISLPGLALAILAASTLKEPRRLSRSKTLAQVVHGHQPGFGETMTTLLKKPTYRQLLLCCVTWFFCQAAIVQWMPTFFVRSHGLQTGQLGTWLAIAFGGAGLAGTWLGGEWGACHAPQNERVQLIGSAWMYMLYGIFTACAFIVPNPYWAFGAVAVGTLSGFAALGPIFATLQTVTPPSMRAMGLIFVTVFPSFLGAGLGPWAAGALSDFLRPWAAGESLRYTLLLLTPGYCCAAWSLWSAAKTVAADVGDSVMVADAQLRA